MINNIIEIPSGWEKCDISGVPLRLTFLPASNGRVLPDDICRILGAKYLGATNHKDRTKQMVMSFKPIKGLNPDPDAPAILYNLTQWNEGCTVTFR